MLYAKSGRKGPQADDSVKGVIQFRAGGSAFVIVDGKRDEPSIQIAPEDTGAALPGDTGVVPIYLAATGRRPGSASRAPSPPPPARRSRPCPTPATRWWSSSASGAGASSPWSARSRG